MVGDEIENRLLQGAGAEKMVWLKEFALQKTKPNLNLIQPGGVDRQPGDLDAQLVLQSESLFLKPTGQLFRRVRGSIVQDQDHGLDLASQRFRNDNLLQERTKVDEALPGDALSIDQAISNRESCHQMPHAATMVTW